MVNRSKALRWLNILAVVAFVICGSVVEASAQSGPKRSQKSVISGGVIVSGRTASSSNAEADSLGVESLVELTDSLGGGEAMDSLTLFEAMKAVEAIDSLAAERGVGVDSIALSNIAGGEGAPLHPHEHRVQADTTAKKSFISRFISDSTSLSKMCWTAAVLPGYGQVYNKQYWKLPILYGTLGASLALFANENKTYKPLKATYDELTYSTLNRTDEIDAVQASMIRSNTRRQIYMGVAISSYIYFLGDAAVNYSTNDVSTVKKATTLAMICPGAGQIYNGSYWKVPFVVGGFASMIYVIDWNTRGYTRFKKAYSLRYDYDINPDDYPDGSQDEFGGSYSSSYLKSIRDSYRRNRDLSYILLAGLYILQIVDAHVDAHLRDYDISDDLTMNIEPLIKTTYSPASRSECATYGFNINMTF